jgi:hypothetical protein
MNASSTSLKTNSSLSKIDKKGGNKNGAGGGGGIVL